MTIEKAINQSLPQTQCQKCGFIDCAAYAKAIASNEVEINRCSPGGDSVINELAKLLDRNIIELAPDLEPSNLDSTAIIDENFCIGCTLCIDACPIDAIVGGAKRMHSILNSVCSGCRLCLPVCPTDCIEIVSLSEAFQKGKNSTRVLQEKNLKTRAKLWQSRYETNAKRTSLKTEKKTDSPKRNRIVSEALQEARKKLSLLPKQASCSRK